MRLVKLLSYKAWILLFGVGVWLSALGGYSETIGMGWLYLCENSSTHRYSGQQDNVHSSENILRGWINSVHKEKFPIEMGAKLGPRRWFSKSKEIPIILCIFIAVWGAAIILVLGAILYFIVIEPFIKRESKDRTKCSKNN